MTDIKTQIAAERAAAEAHTKRAEELEAQLKVQDKYFDLTGLGDGLGGVRITQDTLKLAGLNPWAIQVRCGGPTAGRALWLIGQYNWKLLPHADDGYELIPARI